MSEFQTIAQARKYFENVEQRYNEGTLRPSSQEGLEVVERLLVVVTDMQRMIDADFQKVKAGDINAAQCLLYLADLRSRFILLLGKFEGFKYGQKFVVARAGVYSQYLT